MSKEQKPKLFSKVNAYKAALVFTLGVGVMTLFPSCAKKAQCADETQHAHYYVDEETGLGRYIISEKVTYKSKGQKLARTEERATISDEDKEIINFMNKNGLFLIDYNKEDVAKIMDGKQWLEYAYTYTQTHTSVGVAIGSTSDGNTTFSPVVSSSKTTNTDWTADPNLDEDYTGQKRLVTPTYHAYKIERNKRGKLTLVVSDEYRSLEEMPADYRYFKIDDYKTENYDMSYAHIVDFERAQETEQGLTL